MATIELTNQKTLETQIKPMMTALQNALGDRLDIWRKIPLEKKKAWLESGEDPILTLAKDLYIYLDSTFFGVKNGKVISKDELQPG